MNSMQRLRYNHSAKDMSSITCLDDLPDLVLIELLSYLSLIDVLWGLTHLKHRLTTLCVIDVWNYDELSVFLLLHAATLNRLSIKTNNRSIAVSHVTFFI